MPFWAALSSAEPFPLQPKCPSEPFPAYTGGRKVVWVSPDGVVLGLVGPLTPYCSAQGLLQPHLLWTSLSLQVPVYSAQKMRTLGAALKALDKVGQNQAGDISVGSVVPPRAWSAHVWAGVQGGAEQSVLGAANGAASGAGS